MDPGATGSDHHEIFNTDCSVIEGTPPDNVHVVVVNLVFSCVRTTIGTHILCYGAHIASFFDCGDCIKCKHTVTFNAEDARVDPAITVEVP